MPNFAIIDNNVVVNIIQADSEAIAEEVTGLNCVPVDGRDYGLGLEYDPVADIFILTPRPYNSWTYENGEWVPPTSMPEDGRSYVWEEDSLSWIEDKPFASWTFDEVARKYISPIDYPSDGENYAWNEDEQTWDLVEDQAL